MAGTRTAPAWTATATARRVGLNLIDASGDPFTVSMYVPLAATAANLEVWAAAYQAGTQASLWGLEDNTLREGDADTSNAQTDQRNSSRQGINNSFKNITTRQTLDVRLVAPVPAALQGNQDIPLLSSDELTDLILATLTLQTGYSHQASQYTERQERKNNPKVKS